MGKAPFTLEYDGETLTITSNFDDEVKIRIGESEFRREIKKGKNEIKVSTGNNVVFGTPLEVCNENYCKEIRVSIGTDLALYDEERRLLFARTGLGVAKVVPHPTSRTSKIIHSFQIQEDIQGIALGKESIAVSFGFAVSIYHLSKGKVIRSIGTWEDYTNVSYCCGKYAILHNSEKIYVVDENGKILKKFDVKPVFGEAIYANEEGIIVCSDGCALYDFDGRPKWSFISLGLGIDEVTYARGHWYASSDKGLLVIRNGHVISKVDTGSIISLSACDKVLAVLTIYGVQVYDISEKPWNPELMWSKRLKGNDLVLLGGCNYLVVASKNNLEVFDVNGKKVDRIPRGSEVRFLSYLDERLAMALRGNRVEIMQVNEVVVNDERFLLKSSLFPPDLRGDRYYEFVVSKGIDVEELKLAVELSKKYGIEFEDVPKTYLILRSAVKEPFGEIFEPLLREINDEYVIEAIKASERVRKEFERVRRLKGLSKDVLEKIRSLRNEVEELVAEETCSASDLVQRVATSKDLEDFVNNVKELVKRFGKEWKQNLSSCLKAEIAQELGLVDTYRALKEYEEVLEVVIPH